MCKKYQDLLAAEPDLFRESPGGYEILTYEEAAACESAAKDYLASRGLPQEWGRVGVAFEDQYLRILRDAVRLPTGKSGTYIRILPAPHLGDGVAIIPVHQGQIVLLRHYRHAVRAWHLEIPRGFGDKNLTPEQNARRELREEIGCQGERLTALGEIHPDSGLMAHKVHLFCAEIDGYSGPQKDREAISDILKVSASEFEELFVSGTITDSFTICAFAQARARSIF